MTFRENLAVLRERWVLVVLTVALAMVASAAVWALRPEQYTATLTLYVSARTADTVQTAYQGGLLSQQRVKPYIELIRSVRVSEQVVADLRLPLTPEQVAAEIDATSTPDSVLIDVGVTDPDARQAAAIVNGVSTVFVRLADELERSATPNAQPVAVRIVRPASVPSQPSSPDLPVMLALGLLGGLVLGAGAAVARHLLDTTVKSAEQLTALAKAPNLTTIGYDGAVRKRPLTVHEPPDAPRVEAFRQLRTNLRFVDLDSHHKVIVVTSSLPAEGTTTTTLNLAIALASGGQKVLVVEADLRRPGAAKLLGLTSTVGLTSVLTYGVPLDQAIQPWSGGVDLLASGPLPPNPAELLGSMHMAALLAEVGSWYDTVLVDTPPLLPVTDAAAIAPAADGVLLVTRFRKTTRDQVAAAVAAISAVSVPLLGTVLNMVPRRGPRAYARYHTYYASHPSSEVPASTAPPVTPRQAVRPHTNGQRSGAHAKPDPLPVNGVRPSPTRRSVP
jgi:succinoglycan biosynthesis transport protein ExoP